MTPEPTLDIFYGHVSRGFFLFITSLSIFYGISLITPLLNGYAGYPLAVIQCGKQPYIKNDFAAAHTYTVPGDARYSQSLGLFTSPDDFYCNTGRLEYGGYQPYVWGPEACKTYELPGSTPRVRCNETRSIWLNYLPIASIVLIGSGLYLASGNWDIILKRIGLKINWK